MKRKSYTNPALNPTRELRVKETKSQRGGAYPTPPKAKGFVAALMHRTWGLLGRLRDKETKSQKVKETKSSMINDNSNRIFSKDKRNNTASRFNLPQAETQMDF